MVSSSSSISHLKTMANLAWREAIIQVLQGSEEAMHYVDIAESIVEGEVRTDVGATPAATVVSIISTSLQAEDGSSPFIRVERGRYWLRKKSEQTQTANTPPLDPLLDDVKEVGLINGFGMYWSRDSVLWNTNPKILGRQQVGSSAVDFSNQHGVYLLHDGRSVIYVGRTTDQSLGSRLRHHTIDRLNGRWDRFSWFGVYGIDEQGNLLIDDSTQFDMSMLIVTMEALLIEGLEPPQNRKRGDDFRAIEFLQLEDPAIQKSQILDLMDHLKKQL